MDKLLVVVFGNQNKADAGFQTLRDLHAEGSVSLYNVAVVAKDANGQTTITRDSPPGPLGMAVGLLAGTLVGLPGGPVGVALGATAGTVGGTIGDLASLGIGAEFVNLIAARFEPGTWAVVAEVQEENAEVVDARLQALGGTVYRRTRADVASTQIERDILAAQAELDAMQAAYDQANHEARADLQNRIDAAKAKLQTTRDRAKTELEATRSEADAKVAALNAQAATARAERKQQIEDRIAEVQAAYRERAAKLNQASQLAREALILSRPGEKGGLSEGVDAETSGHPAIERVHEGMVVVGADGKEIGKVKLIRMGDPEAVSTEGQERTITFATLALKEEPDVPEALRSGLLRMGYLKVERGGVLGIGEREHYVRSDRIAKVAGDQVVLTVAEAQLPEEQAD